MSPPPWWDDAAADEATIRMCERTGWRGPRDYLLDCPRCGHPFWINVTSHGGHRGAGALLVFCSDTCRMSHRYHTHPTYKQRMLDRQRERRRAARKVA